MPWVDGKLLSGKEMLFLIFSLLQKKFLPKIEGLLGDQIIRDQNKMLFIDRKKFGFK